MIFNNKEFAGDLTERRGTDIDRDKLAETFTALKFEVRRYEDKSDSAILQYVTKASLEDHSKFDCFVCCILSHGAAGVVYGSNGKTLPIRKLTDRLCAQSCLSLSGKPKIFVIQACQGESIQRAYPSMEADATGETEKLIPGEGDFLLAYSTVPGYKSFRDTEDGSFFISKLTEMLNTYADRESVLDILTRVNEGVGDEDMYTDDSGHCKQAPGHFSSLRKKLYLSSFPIQLHSAYQATTEHEAVDFPPWLSSQVADDEGECGDSSLMECESGNFSSGPESYAAESVLPDSAHDDNMQIFVIDKATGRNNAVLNVSPSSTIRKVKQQLREETGLAEDQQRLTLDGRKLKDSRTLAHYDVREGSTLDVTLRGHGTGSEAASMYINVTPLTGDPIELLVFRSDSIGQVKEKIEQKLGVPASRQSLLFASRQHDNARTLAECGVTPESTLRLIVRKAPP